MESRGRHCRVLGFDSVLARQMVVPYLCRRDGPGQLESLKSMQAGILVSSMSR